MLASSKGLVKRLIPRRYRMARYVLAEKLRYYPELFFSLGRRLQCPFCGWQFRRFRPAGFDYPVLRELMVVGAAYHHDDVCPRCLSNARERLVYLFLTSRTTVFKEALRLLHIAPEPMLATALKRNTRLRRVSGDLFEEGVMVKFDVLDLPFEDSSFDVILCNHVLEHVSDDRRAMSELHRVLAPHGWAILQVPIARALCQTLEDKSVVTEEDRIRVYGQKDHVRLYAAEDYTARLRTSGFRVKVHGVSDLLGETALLRHGLVRDEDVYFCSKSQAPGGFVVS